MSHERVWKQSNEKSEEGHSFCKIIFPHPVISKQIQIPPDFIEHIDKCTFKKATLRGPSGHSWPVKLHENKRGIFVKNGWDRFFEDHSLGPFDFLIFIYDGETCFDVRIFEKDGLEKDISTQDDAPTEDEIKSEREELYDAPPHGESVPINGRRKRGRPRKNSLNNYQPPFSPRRKGKGIQTDELEYLKNPKEKNWPKVEAKEEIIELSDEEFSKSNQREVIDSIYAKKYAFRSRFPFFGKYIDSENLDKKYIFKLPRIFAEKYLPKKYTTIILTNENGNSWEVKFNLLGDSFPHFCGGWVSFMRDNKLELGDHCIFELVKEKEMKVYISRSRESI